tara:strand:- start:482 stop:877 length:396 start_codon:yes stop_codon:yes gene_type:complete
MWGRVDFIVNWFNDFSERRRLVRNFNRAAKEAFIAGLAPTLLECRISNGDSSYRHNFSKLFGGGFRIKALSGIEMNRQDMKQIGAVVLDNEELVRKLISLGWDTLEVHDNAGWNGLKWKLYDYAGIGGILN